MSTHGYCELNCGGTDCDAPTRTVVTASAKPASVFAFRNGAAWVELTIREAAIEEIKAQPFFG